MFSNENKGCVLEGVVVGLLLAQWLRLLPNAWSLGSIPESGNWATHVETKVSIPQLKKILHLPKKTEDPKCYN